MAAAIRPRSRSLRTALALALTGAAVAAGGCGSSSSTGSGGDPTSVIPASAPVYVGVTVRPGGSLHDNTVAAARRLTHLQDPFGRLIAALEQGSHPRVDYQRDIKPWLGGRVAAFFTSLSSAGKTQGGGSGLVQRGLAAGSSFASGGSQGAIVAATTDPGAARSFLAKQSSARGAHTATYRGVKYQLLADGTAEGVVDSFLVAGSRSGFQSVVDTAQGGPPLTRAPAFQATSQTSPDVLAQAYVNVNQLLDSVAAGGRSSQSLLLARQFFAALHLSTVNLALTVPDSHSIALEARTPSSGAQASGAQSGADVLAGLPGDSWLAAGVGNLGGTLSGLVNGLSNLGSLGGVKVGGLVSQLNHQAGLNVQRDLLSWMGGAGVFVRGSSLLDLGVGVVIQSKDAARSKAAVAKLGRALRRGGDSVQPLTLPGTDAAIAVHGKSSPFTFDIVDGGGKFVIGLGNSAVNAALAPSSTLAGTSSYAAAKAALGDGIRPSLMVSFPSLLGLVEGVGAGSSAGVSAAKPYLQTLNMLIAGGQTAGSVHRSRIVLTLS